MAVFLRKKRDAAALTPPVREYDLSNYQGRRERKPPKTMSKDDVVFPSRSGNHPHPIAKAPSGKFTGRKTNWSNMRRAPGPCITISSVITTESMRSTVHNWGSR